MVFEVCRSLALDQTNLFLLAFLPATGLALINLEEGDNWQENSNTYWSNRNHREPAQSVCVADCYFIVTGVPNKHFSQNWLCDVVNASKVLLRQPMLILNVNMLILMLMLNLPEKIQRNRLFFTDCFLAQFSPEICREIGPEIGRFF